MVGDSKVVQKNAKHPENIMISIRKFSSFSTGKIISLIRDPFKVEKEVFKTTAMVLFL